ncbi:MAG TPA: LLM class flavin-dependent oxidoreductase [Candidatus Binataceae bacterium]|nr:LLM class flavin-dependent oxidoreductase [Candidatus Binataceae bacterium]
MADSGKKIGLHMTLGAGQPGRYPQLARRAEELAYASLWIAEAGSADGLVSMTAFAGATSRIKVASGVLPIQIRTPAAMATAFLTLNEVSGGRAIAGLGVSSPIIVERWHGAAYRKPVTAMRECVAIMRQLFNEGRSKFAGEIYHSDFRLGFRPTHPAPPLYLAALNPPMLQLAGEVADGVLLNYSPAEGIPAMLAEVDAGAAKAGRPSNAIDRAIYIRMCVTPDERIALDAFKRELAGYSFVDNYDRMFARYGLGAEFAEVRRLWKEGRREDAPGAISDASARKLASFGSPDEARAMVARFRAAGVSLPVIFPVGPRETAERDFLATMEATAGT